MRSFVRSHSLASTVLTNFSKLLPISQTPFYPFRKQLQSIHPSLPFLSQQYHRTAHPVHDYSHDKHHTPIAYQPGYKWNLKKKKKISTTLLPHISLVSGIAPGVPTPGLYSHPQHSTYHSVPPLKRNFARDCWSCKGYGYV